MKHASLGGNWNGGSHYDLCSSGSESGGGGEVASQRGRGSIYFNGGVTRQAVCGESGEARYLYEVVHLRVKRCIYIEGGSGGEQAMMGSAEIEETREWMQDLYI